MFKRTIAQVLRHFGYEIHRIPRPIPSGDTVAPPFDRVHYACGRTVLPDWLNVDIIADGPSHYMYVNLCARHPFPDEYFNYGFCEDFIEHVDQASVLMFLVEAHRTLKKGGVLRLTTPSFEGVLSRHYRRSSFADYEIGRNEAFSSLGHVHFFSVSTIRLMAEHIGFEIAFVESGTSSHSELSGLNTRSDSVNLHVELTKR